MAHQITPARLVAAASFLLALYLFARVVVLFFEALTIVGAARTEDEALLQLCTSGQASGSGKMREACLKAHAERASPIVFKAVVQAVSTAFKDFSDAAGSPFKVALLVFFVISSVTMPIIPWARCLLGASSYVDGSAPSNGVHYIDFAPPTGRCEGLQLVRRKAMRALRMRQRGGGGGDGGDSDETDVEPGRAALAEDTWHNIALDNDRVRWMHTKME